MSEFEETQPSYSLRLFADYYQLYLQDGEDAEDVPDDWSEQLIEQKIAVSPGVIGISTARNMTVPVQVNLLTSKPDNDDFSNWDHVAEASLEITSSNIIVAGCSDYFPDALHIPVLPGLYRVRVYYGELGSISEDGLRGNDHYRVVIWPEKEYRVPEILKKW